MCYEENDAYLCIIIVLSLSLSRVEFVIACLFFHHHIHMPTLEHFWHSNDSMNEKMYVFFFLKKKKKEKETQHKELFTTKAIHTWLDKCQSFCAIIHTKVRNTLNAHITYPFDPVNIHLMLNIRNWLNVIHQFWHVNRKKYSHSALTQYTDGYDCKSGVVNTNMNILFECFWNLWIYTIPFRSRSFVLA